MTVKLMKLVKLVLLMETVKSMPAKQHADTWSIKQPALIMVEQFNHEKIRRVTPWILRFKKIYEGKAMQEPLQLKEIKVAEQCYLNSLKRTW